MSVKIYDSTIGAFKDAETPKIWDEQAQAWKDSVGLVWNESAQAWEERWPAIKSPLYLYNEGDECTDATGGWNGKGMSSSQWTGGISTIPTITKNTDNIYATLSSNQLGIVRCLKLIPLSSYSKLCAMVSGYTGTYSSIALQLYNTLTPGYIENNVAEIPIGSKASSSITETIPKCTITLDISDVTDDCMIAFRLISVTQLNVYKVWLEK